MIVCNTFTYSDTSIPWPLKLLDVQTWRSEPAKQTDSVYMHTCTCKRVGLRMGFAAMKWTGAELPSCKQNTSTQSVHTNTVTVICNSSRNPSARGSKLIHHWSCLHCNVMIVGPIRTCVAQLVVAQAGVQLAEGQQQ